MKPPHAGITGRPDSPEPTQSSDTGSQSDANAAGVTSPGIAIPRGGGAIGGIGEKFAVSPVTGTSSFSVPIAVSRGRSGFQPNLQLSYDSGAGNTPFGLGWNVGLPSIRRKTQQGIPQYRDGVASDTFLLAGAEDLVPALGPDDQPILIETEQHLIHPYHPRVEGGFARIERWVDRTTGDMHWRTTSRDNVVSIFGATSSSRVAENDRRVFEWLIEWQYDSLGNAIHFGYKPEDTTGVSSQLPEERSRLKFGTGFTGRYPKLIRYGNTTTAGRCGRFLRRHFAGTGGLAVFGSVRLRRTRRSSALS